MDQLSSTTSSWTNGSSRIGYERKAWHIALFLAGSLTQNNGKIMHDFKRKEAIELDKPATRPIFTMQPKDLSLTSNSGDILRRGWFLWAIKAVDPPGGGELHEQRSYD